MSNALYKSITTTVIPGQPAIPGSPGSAGQAARTEFIDFDTPEASNFFIGLFGTQATSPAYGPYTQTPFGESLTIGTGTYNTISLVYSNIINRPRIRIDYPFIPASPPISGSAAIPDQVVTDLNIGWNASANSIDSTILITPPRPYFMEIVIPNSTRGAIVGAREFNGVNVVNGFEMIGGVLALIANRARVKENVAHADGDTLRIVSSDDLTEFYVDGVLVHQADTNTPPTPGNMLGLLYMGGDYVEDPALGLVNIGFASMAPMDGFGGVAGTGSGGGATFQKMTALGISGQTAHFLPMIAAGGNAAQFNGYAAFQPMTAEAGSFNTTAHPALQGGFASFQPLRALGQSIIARVSGEASFLPMDAIGANYAYAGGGGSFLPMTAFGVGHQEGLDEGYILGGATVAPSLRAYSIVAVAISESMEIAYGLLALGSTNASILSQILADDSYLAQAIANAIVMHTVQTGGGDAPPFANPGTVWVVNAENAASSTYSDFEFNSYARIGGRYYGLRPEGLYSLDADEDDWGPVIGRVDFGRLNFGGTEQKRVTDVYAGMSTSGTMYLRVTADGETYTYRSNRKSAELQTERFVPGKGIKANWLGFELVNAEDTDFELSTIEFHAIRLTRRI